MLHKVRAPDGRLTVRRQLRPVFGDCDIDVLIVGATGMLGRPVARRLVAEGFEVRAVVRNPSHARSQLPEKVEVVAGDLRDEASIRAACYGARAVHINLAVPMRRRPPSFDPERDGTANVVAAARAAGVEQLTRISASGVETAAGRWWAAAHKLAADDAVLSSGITATILRPTWFMESLATCLMGRVFVDIRVRGKLRWIAGDDFAHQVAAALREPERYEGVHTLQGPETLTTREAGRRFVAALGRRSIRVPVPRFMSRLMGRLAGKPAYLDRLLEWTEHEFSEIDREAVPTSLPTPTMTIEDYVRSMLVTGDHPHK